MKKAKCNGNHVLVALSDPFFHYFPWKVIFVSDMDPLLSISIIFHGNSQGQWSINDMSIAIVVSGLFFHYFPWKIIIVIVIGCFIQNTYQYIVIYNGVA